MKIIERVKGIILSPKSEWEVISGENLTVAEMFGSFLFPLALIPAIASFIGYGLIGMDIPFAGHVGSFGLGIKQAAIQLISIIAGVFISAFVINALAPNFNAVKNFNKAFELVCYSYSPMMVFGLLLILPSLGIIVLIASVYGLYLLYIGLKPMMGVSEEKVTGYFVVSLIVIVVVSIVLSAILSRIFLPNYMTMPY